jgi:hypothetical protein
MTILFITLCVISLAADVILFFHLKTLSKIIVDSTTTQNTDILSLQKNISTLRLDVEELRLKNTSLTSRVNTLSDQFKQWSQLHVVPSKNGASNPQPTSSTNPTPTTAPAPKKTSKKSHRKPNNNK